MQIPCKQDIANIYILLLLLVLLLLLLLLLLVLLYYVYYASFFQPSPLPSFDSARKLDVREISIFGGARKLDARKLDARNKCAQKLSE